MIKKLICEAKTKWFLVISIIFLTVVSCENDTKNGNLIQNNIVIQLNDTLISLTVGGQQKLLYNSAPVNGKWISTDTTIAKVNNQGIITGVSVGDATISVTGNNNFSGKCKVRVTDSPISELIMPAVNYPIKNGATIVLKGTGFKEGDKIWLRKHITNSSVSKVKGAYSESNASVGSDYLATIHEIAANYIALSANVPDGWFQIILEEENKAYNLGNLQFNTVELPEYSYDKSKIFWDDTHLRWIQLRGPVKEMKVAQIDYWGTTLSPMTVYYLFRFNNIGYLTSSLSSWGDSVSLGYNKSNKIVTMIQYPGTNSISGNVFGVGEEDVNRYTFTYGNHTKYYRLGVNGAGSNPFLIYMSDRFGMGSDFSEGFWVKGLTGITSKNEAFNLSLYSDSIVTTNIDKKKNEYKSTLSYNGIFPFQETRRIKPVDYIYNYYKKYSFSFANNGQLNTHLSAKYELSTNTFQFNYDSIGYKKNTPFQLYNTNVIYKGGVRKFKYDNNFNVIEDEWNLETEGTVITSYFNYVSYDKYGNWTQCVVIENDNRWPDNDKIWKLTREFKYW